MNCPKCGAGMQAVTFQGIEFDRCSSCAGLWFDIMEEEQLKKLAGSEQVDVGDEKVGQALNEKGRIQCPKDSTPMVRMVVAGQPHIWFESCSVCQGTYFDAGEFKDFKAETFADWVKGFSNRERN